MKSMKAVATLAISAVLMSGALVVPAAAAAASSGPGVVTGDWVNLDFTASDLQPVNNVLTVDSQLVGTSPITPGSNNAGTVVDGGQKALMLEATTAAITAYRGGINRTVRTGIETRVKFSSTDSLHSLFEMKGMTPPTGTASWPTLLRFDATGRIVDWKGSAVGTYAANQWYNVSLDIDPTAHKYSAWLDGAPLITDLDLGNYVGILQNKIIQAPNSTKTATRTYFSYLRAGTITPAVTSISAVDGTVEKGKVFTPQLTASPAGAQASGYTSPRRMRASPGPSAPCSWRAPQAPSPSPPPRTDRG